MNPTQGTTLIIEQERLRTLQIMMKWCQGEHVDLDVLTSAGVPVERGPLSFSGGKLSENGSDCPVDTDHPLQRSATVLATLIEQHAMYSRSRRMHAEGMLAAYQARVREAYEEAAIRGYPIDRLVWREVKLWLYLGELRLALMLASRAIGVQMLRHATSGIDRLLATA